MSNDRHALIYDVKVRAAQVQIQLDRLRLDIDTYLKVVDNIDTSGSKIDGDDLNAAETITDLDTHVLLSVAHSLFKLCRQAEFDMKRFEAFRQVVETLRDNFEHWDENSQYFRDRNLIPMNSAARYLHMLDSGHSASSPRGSYSLPTGDPNRIIIGDVLDTTILEEMLLEVDRQLTAL